MVIKNAGGNQLTWECCCWKRSGWRWRLAAERVAPLRWSSSPSVCCFLSLSLSPSLFFFWFSSPLSFFTPLPFLEALRWPFIGPYKRWFFSTSLPSWDEDKSCWGVSLLLGLGHQQSCHGWIVGDGFRSEIQRRVVSWGRPDWFENRGTPNGLYFPRV